MAVHTAHGMPLIPIIDAGRSDEVDVARLQRMEIIHENDERIVRTVEYCWLACPGTAHQTGIADTAACFCCWHVHRSLHVDVKRWPIEAGAVAAALGS